MHLDELLGATGAWLAAENGFFLKRGGRQGAGADQWEAANDNVDLSWREGVQRVFEYFTGQLLCCVVLCCLCCVLL